MATAHTLAPELTDEELDRYARHIILREIGGQGQLRLKAARVLVIGAGGLGSPCLQYLAAAGVGTLVVADDDTVERSNLQRQPLFGDADIGRAKVEAAADSLRRLNPGVKVEPLRLRVGPDNLNELVAGCTVVADGSDNFATRLAVADAAHRARVTLVSAAIGAFDGQLATFRGWEPGLPCYRCLVGADPDRAAATCADQGVLGALPGVMGALQALEVVKEIVGFGESLAGRLLLYDALAARMRTLKLPKDPGCAGCGGG